MTLDKTFEERYKINNMVMKEIDEAAEHWGIECFRYEIKDISMTRDMQETMTLQAESERKKRARILRADGYKTSYINIGNGDREEKIQQAKA
jgi:regulator of protease activity HflC (stomatin/prohibitin superfamily)